MEKKKFDLYTEEERKQLLIHWFSFYSEVEVSLIDVSCFLEHVKKDSLLIGNMALLSYSMGCFNQPYLMAIREGVFDEYLESVKKIVGSSSYKNFAEKLWPEFLDEIVGSYDADATNELIVSSIEHNETHIVEDDTDDFYYVVYDDDDDHDEEKCEDENYNNKNFCNNQVFNSTYKKFFKMYNKCLLNKQEIKENGPTVNFVFGEGVCGASLFSAERVEKYKEDIDMLLDEFFEDEGSISFLDLLNDNNEVQWARNYETVDLLVRLGVAVGSLQIDYVNEDSNTMIGCIPYVTRKNMQDEKIVGKKPNEYRKIMQNFNDNYS